MSKYRHQVNELLLDIKQGNKAAAETLYELTFNHLKTIALCYLYNKTFVEDVLSESYCRVFNYIGTFDEFKDGYNWMCRIVQNVAMDINKKELRYSADDEIDAADLTFVEDTDSILLKDELHKAMAAYSEFDTLLIYYRFYLDWTYEAIAEKLRCSKAYAHKRMKIVIQNLSLQLKR